ncbi:MULTISPECIES: site-specific integrase [Pseudomonas]|uniref:site-specific integrase n=1 Tax=Pseudomonas TaxID=286 RepID=UPI0008116915|nr:MULTISPECIES: site-specific integrase [Pseudomonas]
MKVREFKDFQGRPSALIFDKGKPVFLANYWMANFKPGLAPKSRVLLAYDLSIVMLHFKMINTDIESRFTNGKYFTAGEIVRLRNCLEEYKQTVEMRAGGVGILVPRMACSSAFIRRCRAAREFLEAAAEEICRSSCQDENGLRNFKLILRKHLPCKQKNDGPSMVEPLSESEFSEMDTVLKDQVKLGKRAKLLIHRDLVVFHLLRELGIRNSELLGIMTDGFARTAAGYMTVHICRNKDLASDPRTSPATVKTLERTLKISDNLWTLIERYIVERKKLSKAKKHKFLIVTFDGAPLSNDAVGSLFTKLRKHIGRPLSPHTLRHSWACNFILTEFEKASTLTSREKERTIASALSVLRAHMGWTLSSSMPDHYARYAFQKIGNDRLISEEQLLHASLASRSEHEKD